MGNLQDFATGIVATAPSPAMSGTSLTLQSGQGALFPPRLPFSVVAHPDGELPTIANAERLLVTSVSSNTFTVQRARGVTTAKSIAVGWRISNAIFASDLSVYTVSVESYGALGNGTDSSTAIQSAINEVEAAGGGTVFFPAGNYILNATLTIDSSAVVLMGEGLNSTTLTLKTGVNANMISITGTGTIGVEIHNMTLNGMKANQTSGDGIYINTPYSVTDTNHFINNVDVVSARNSGIRIEGDTRVVRMNQVRVRWAAGNAYSLAGSDHQFTTCFADAAAFNGFVIYGGNNNFVGCKAFYCAETAGNGYAGFRVEYPRNFFTACEAQDNREHGFRFISAADGCQVTGCVADSNGQGWQGAGSGVSIEDSDNISVVGGSSFDRNGPDNLYTQVYGVTLSGTSTGNKVVGMTYYDNATGDYSDTSTGVNRHVTGEPTITVGTSAPTNPSLGDIWVDVS